MPDIFFYMQGCEQSEEKKKPGKKKNIGGVPEALTIWGGGGSGACPTQWKIYVCPSNMTFQAI